MAAARLPQRAPRAEVPKVESFDDDTSNPYWDLVNRNPSFHYVWANGDPRAPQNVDYYESRGYLTVEYDPEGVRPRLGGRRLKAGDAIEREGHVLMHAPLETKNALSARAMQRYDQMEAAFIKRAKADMVDGLRGIGGNAGFSYVRPAHDLTEISETTEEHSFT